MSFFAGFADELMKLGKESKGKLPEGTAGHAASAALGSLINVALWKRLGIKGSKLPAAILGAVAGGVGSGMADVDEP